MVDVGTILIRIAFNFPIYKCLHLPTLPVWQETPAFARIFCGIENNRLAQNGGVEGGGWCEREFKEEAGEEPVEVGWNRGMYGRRKVDEESGCDGVEG